MTDEELEQQFRIQKYRKLGLDSKLHGTVLQKLPVAKTVWSNDLFLVSRPNTQAKLSSNRNILNDYFEGRFNVEDSPSGAYIIDENPDIYFSASRTSYAIRYADLCASVLADTYLNIDIGTMALEQSADYALRDHNHDDVYSSLSAESYYPVKDAGYWHLGELTISSYTESGQLKSQVIDFNCPIPEMPTFEDPDVGELRFMVQSQLTSYSMKQYGEQYNVDIYSDTFDGWVYPNGTVFTTQTESDFGDAKDAYGIDSSSFQVPDLRHFIKLNPGLNKTDGMAFTPYKNAMLAHTHEIENLKCDGSLSFDGIEMGLGNGGNVNGSDTICGWGVRTKYIGEIAVHASGKLTNATFAGQETQYTDESLDIESKPVHNLMPVMVFIGRRTKTEA